MPSIFKLEKEVGGKIIYDIYFLTKIEAWEWVIKNKDEGFFKCSIKEVKTNEKHLRRDQEPNRKYYY